VSTCPTPDCNTTLEHDAISLDSIFHHKGVNALAEDQSLKFGKNLTVVYGDNGAGKTGYIRILKDSCRARGQEKILGNVVSGDRKNRRCFSTLWP
jgi:ABC-type multidrug transport system ATPase subunit